MLAKKMRAMGAANVIIKMGSRGCFAASADGWERLFAPMRVRAVDTTAAGDAFNGGLASALAGGDGLEAAIEFATVVAATSVTRPGAQPAMPTREDISVFLKNSSKRSDRHGLTLHTRPGRSNLCLLDR